MLTPRASGGAEWCDVAAHIEGKLQIKLPEGWDPEVPGGGKELLSLIDLQAWMRRAPFGHCIGVSDVVRAVKPTAAAGMQRGRIPLGALSEASTPKNRTSQQQNTPGAAAGSKVDALVGEENSQGVATRRRTRHRMQSVDAPVHIH